MIQVKYENGEFLVKGSIDLGYIGLAEAIVKTQTLASGAGNTNYGKVELIVSP